MLKHNFVEGFCQGDFEYVSCGHGGLLKNLYTSKSYLLMSWNETKNGNICKITRHIFIVWIFSEMSVWMRRRGGGRWLRDRNHFVLLPGEMLGIFIPHNIGTYWAGAGPTCSDDTHCSPLYSNSSLGTCLIRRPIVGVNCSNWCGT